MDSLYSALSKYTRELIGIRKVNKDIQTFFIYGKTQNLKYRNHSKVFVLNDIPDNTLSGEH